MSGPEKTRIVSTEGSLHILVKYIFSPQYETHTKGDSSKTSFIFEKLRLQKGKEIFPIHDS